MAKDTTAIDNLVDRQILEMQNAIDRLAVQARSLDRLIERSRTKGVIGDDAYDNAAYFLNAALIDLLQGLIGEINEINYEFVQSTENNG